MVLKPIASGVVVSIAAKVWKDQQGCLSCIFRLVLTRLPDFRAQTVGATDAFDIQRIGSGVSDIDIVHGDPQQAGRNLPHQLTRDVHRELVRTRQRLRMSFEVINRKLQQNFQLLEFEVVACQLGHVERHLVIVAKKMLIIRLAAGHCCREQMFGQNYPGAGPGAIRTMTAFADAVESIAGRHHPGIGRWTLQVLPIIFKDCRILGRKRGEIIYRLINAGCQAGGCDVVAQNSAIHYLREESRLRD